MCVFVCLSIRAGVRVCVRAYVCIHIMQIWMRGLSVNTLVDAKRIKTFPVSDVTLSTVLSSRRWVCATQQHPRVAV